MDTFAAVIIIILLIYIIIQLHKIMAKQDEFNALMVRLDAATTEIAKDLTALREEIKDTISSESLTTLDANISKLEELGKDPQNPVPEETPQ